MKIVTVYAGDIGTEFRLDTGLTLTGATGVAIKVKKPDGTTDTWVGTVYDTTKIKYVTVSGDVVDSGVYQLQAYVDKDGFKGCGDIVKEKVLAKLF